LREPSRTARSRADAVAGGIDLDRDEMQVAVAHAALAHRLLGDLANGADGTAQDRTSRQLVIEMDVQVRHLQVVVALTACPQDQNPCNGYQITDIRVEWLA
jgi:hypothetical protein